MAVKKILIIDDDPSVLLLVEDALMQEGYEVVGKNPNNEAVEETDLDQFSLIIMDYKMAPHEGDCLFYLMKIGSSFMKEDLEARENLPPVIIMTGYPDDARVMEWRKDEMVKGFLKKPFEIKELYQTVKKAMGE